MSAALRRAFAPPARRKYGNVKTVVDGVSFDSKKEAHRASALALLLRAGEIRDLRHQVRFALDVNGVPVCHYIADSTYLDKMGALVVEDVKSPITRKNPVYQLKKKLMKAIHNITIQGV